VTLCGWEGNHNGLELHASAVYLPTCWRPRKWDMSTTHMLLWKRAWQPSPLH